MPGYTWGPAWVSWRYGDGYAGWAPLPPDSLIGTDYSNGDTDVGDGFHIGGDADSYYDIGPEWYIFLPVAYFGSYDYRPYYVSRSDNFRLVHGTTNVTNLNIDRHQANGSFGGVSLAGPSLLQVNAQSQTPVPRVNLAFTNRTGGGAVDGSSLSIFAPRVDVSHASGGSSFRAGSAPWEPPPSIAGRTPPARWWPARALPIHRSTPRRKSGPA